MKTNERIVAKHWLKAGLMLGEGPRWDAAYERWIWVDIAAGKVFTRDAQSGEVNSWSPGHHVSLALPESSNHLLIAQQGGISFLDLRSGETSPVTGMELEWEGLRCNDGAIDPDGRLWIGTTAFDHRAGGGDLYVISEDLRAEVRYPAVACSNGLAWSPDGQTLYYTDSLTHNIVAFDFLPDGTLQNERIIISIPPSAGIPDGMTCDAEGMLWIALWGGFGVGRYHPATGEQIAFVEIPVPNATACCFGGADLDELLITTAGKETDLSQYPLAGDLFTAKPGVTGLPANSSSL